MRRVEATKGIVEPALELIFFDQVELVKSFCYLGDRLHASSESVEMVTARARIG